jgi:hypothetical protein
MKTLLKYELKIMLAIGAVMCFTASEMDYFYPTVATIFKLMGFAFAVWSVIEPAREEADDED